MDFTPSSTPCVNPDCHSVLPAEKFMQHPHHTYCFTQRCKDCKKKNYIKPDGTTFGM